MLLMIDNYDSFTYNLVQYFGELGKAVTTIRNDQVALDDLIELKPDHVVVSPGPCDPDQAGISLKAIEYFAGKVPLLGVCLGHQAIGQAFGGKIIRAQKVMHGKTDIINIIKKNNILKNVSNQFIATRYHSLEVSKKLLPLSIEVSAKTKSNNIMAIKIKNKNIYGLQFHPESIATEKGKVFFKNFINICNLNKRKNNEL